MALLDLLGRRWALRIIWELRDDRIFTFRELQARSGNVSSSVLATRLGELREAEVVELVDDGYRLSASGNKLLSLMLPLQAWANGWARRNASAKK